MNTGAGVGTSGTDVKEANGVGGDGAAAAMGANVGALGSSLV